jgi:AraC-like DNA-binding protein/mannose-6-phosphate isomerase-like protein (cupin superfamily)
MWAEIERFGIDELVAADADPGSADRRRRFAVQVPELSSVDVHWHDYYELGFVLDGQATHAVNGVERPLAPGSVFLLSPADFHSIEATGPSPLVMVNAVLQPELVERTLESVRTGDPRLPWSVAELPATGYDVRRVRAEVVRRPPGWEVLVESALTAAVVELARVCDYDDETVGVRGQEASAHLRRAVRYVEQHFREPLTLAQVAAVAHLSPNWFSQQFRRTTGDSFQSYLKRRRLQFARALLGSTELGVTEVAHAAGFNDLSYFGRAYRRQYGVPPSQRADRLARARRGERRANKGAVPP